MKLPYRIRGLFSAYEPLFIFLPCLPDSLTIVQCLFPCPSEPKLNKSKWLMTDVIEIKVLNPQNRLGDMLRANRGTSNADFSTSEESDIVARQKQRNSFKSSKMLPDWFSGVVHWLTWPARNPRTLICDWWGRSMRSAYVSSEIEKAGDEVFE